MSIRPGIWTVAKDVLTYVGGWLIIFKQAGILFDPPPHVNETFIAAGVVMIGVPGLSQLGQAWFGRLTSTGGSQPEPRQPESSPSSPGAS